jgi:MFS family permease
MNKNSKVDGNIRFSFEVPRPFSGSYGAAVALALLALVPNILFTTAFPLMQQGIGHALHATQFQTRLGEALSNAAYSFGAVAAAGFKLRFSQRRLFLIYEAIFVAGSLVVLLAIGAPMFIVGRVLQGLGTGLLLVAALPPLVTNFPASNLPLTAIWVNIGLFGAVTLGPLVGGLAAHFAAWRLLFIGLAVLGVLGWGIALLTLESGSDIASDLNIDWQVFPLAASATALPFFGVSWVGKSQFTNPGFIVPVFVGLLALFVLIRWQYGKSDALIPVQPLFNTLPVCGILAAMIAGAAFVTLVELTTGFMAKIAHSGPLVIGLLLTPEVLGLVIAAWLFRRFLPTRWLAPLAFSGMAATVVGAALLIPLSLANADVIVPIAAALLGYGAGAAVAPGLFVAGMSVKSEKLGRTFALVELLRAEAAFLIGPVLLRIAQRVPVQLGSGLHLSIWITLGIALIGTLCIAALFWLGGAKLHQPDLEVWLDHGGRAFHSPGLLERLRS